MADAYLHSLGIDLSLNQQLGLGISTLLILGTIIYYRSISSSTSSPSSKKSKKKAKKQKKLTVTEQYQQSIFSIEQNVKSNIQPEIETYYESFSDLSADDKLYKFNFYQEALLKELIKLDGIDLTVLTDQFIKSTLKSERKLIIKHIQGLQKGLDAFKKENIEAFPKA